MTARHTRDNPHQTEAYLEGYFRRAVRNLLRGHLLKLAPTEKGVPDRLVLLPGGHLELVELKTTEGRLAPAQRFWHDRAYKSQQIIVTVLYGKAEIDAWIAARGSHSKYTPPRR